LKPFCEAGGGGVNSLFGKALSAGLFVFVFFVTGCPQGGSGGGKSEPELAKWNGTWNSFANFIDESWLDSFFTQAATAISASTSQSVSADMIKGLAKQVFTLPFKSLIITENAITFYPQPDAGGTGTTMSYTFIKKETDEEDEEWYYFEGGQAGTYKYIVAIPPDQDSTQTPIHFHFSYDANSFDATFAKMEAMQIPVGIRKGTTNEQIIAQWQVLLAEIPWAEIFASLPQ
jgi:Zn/Cd-binding protein ZinT